MHEILTLQLGQRSNYLATHFWNTQESYFTYSGEPESVVDHDIHFRPGIGADGRETFTPRTVIYDLKGGFGSLKKINALYEMEEEAGMQQGLWNGPAVVQRQAAIEQSPYQKSLEDGSVPAQLTTGSVRYWSDFNRVFFHPKSIVQLNEYELGSTLMPFEKWTTGEELFDTLDKEHDLLDRDLRPFAEESDQMQGIQLMASVDDAWGGFAARYMDRLRDEYGKTTIWVWGLEDGMRNTPRDKHFLKLSNTARSVAEVSSHASLFIPLTLPSNTLPSYVNIDKKSPWHVSALFSTALESMTLGSRLRTRNGNRESLDELAGALNVNGNQNIAKLQMSIGTPPSPNGDAHTRNFDPRSRQKDSRMPLLDGSALERNKVVNEVLNLDMNFFPAEEPTDRRSRLTKKKTHIFGEAEAFRSEEEVNDHDENDFDGQERARRRAAGLPIIHKTWTPMPFPLLDSFPRIYSPTTSSPSSSSTSVRTSLSTDTAVALRIKGLRAVVSRSVDVEERETLSNTLGEIAEGYEEGWDSGSDEDDD